jgi:hypothetical protein|tara:strand:- start:225 stop:482 length:258 start_codon:yes stop_codon:yes gene_type:complete
MTNEKLVPMTTEEEDRNADVVRDSNGNVMPEKLSQDDRGELDLTKMVEIQQKEIKDLFHDNKILIEEVERLSNLMQKLKKLLPRH